MVFPFYCFGGGWFGFLFWCFLFVVLVWIFRFVGFGFVVGFLFDFCFSEFPSK